MYILCTTQTCRGFNVDVRFPILKEGTTKGSFFGLSVAQHYQTASRQYTLLVGAPKDKALETLNVNETGAIYSCPISSKVADCTRMNLITKTDSSEMIEGMWLGVTVASQREAVSGRILACGHRYVKLRSIGGTEEDQRSMVGKCFVRGNDLTYNAEDMWQSHTYETCDPNSEMKGEGMCGMGMSGGLTANDVYIGCTGSYEWQGNVYVTWRHPDDTWDSVDKSFGSLKKRNIYMGYSVTEEKRLLKANEYTVVSGAPRDESKGSVTLAAQEKSKLVAVMTIPGEQVGSYFGSSIAVTDLNNDGWNDLIIGAPFYFDRNKDEGGAVYIFMNENGSFQQKANLILKGVSGSAFGLAVAAIGDINQDGFQDIAVGAPFFDSGKVYIWMGSNQGIQMKHSQEIQGNSVNKGFRTFGYSINGGMDMDNNNYPDILVGSLDDRIALLRTRPVIQLSQNLSVEPKIVDPSQCKDSCVTAKFCFSFTLSNGHAEFKKKINVNYTIEADRNQRSPRVLFLSGKNTETDTLQIPGCRELKLKVQEQITNKLDPVVFLLNVSLAVPSESTQKGVQDLDDFPVLSDKQYRIEKTEINFKKECGADNMCHSNLQVKVAQFLDSELKPFPSRDEKQIMEYSVKTLKKLTMVVNVTNKPDGISKAEDAHQALLNITLPHELTYAGVRSKEIQCSVDKTVICDLGNPFKSNTEVSFQIIFEASITIYTDQIKLQLQLSTLSEQSNLFPVPVILNVEYRIGASIQMPVPEVNTYFSGKVMGESAMKSASDVGSPVELRFKVNVPDNPLGVIGTLVVDFNWPIEVANEKWLLYITEILIDGASESHCVPPGNIVNRLNLTLSDDGSTRYKRDADVHLPRTEAVTLHNRQKEIKQLDCSTKTARCVTFSCPLNNMGNLTTITIRARVWNSTLLEDYSNAFRVKVKGTATLRLETDKPTIKMTSNFQEFTVNIDPVVDAETPYNAPLWIYITAGVAGILLLGIISLILWKCGFFKRASRREMYEAKSQKAAIKIQPSETERLTEDY